MNRRSFIAGAAGMALGPAAALAQMDVTEEGRELRDFSFTDADGQTLTIRDFRGRVVLLNVWATWCVPCRQEMPTLDRLQGLLGGPDFHVLPLSIDRAGYEVVRRFYNEIGIENLGLYLGEERATMSAFGVIGLPTTLLINRDGREIGRLVGPAEWDSAEAVALFRSVVARSSR
jgi:thiol-disulfide isomerase/thioredoxin